MLRLLHEQSPALLQRADKAGCTPVHYAAYHGHAACVEELHALGCAVLEAGRGGARRTAVRRRAYHWAARSIERGACFRFCTRAVLGHCAHTFASTRGVARDVLKTLCC